MTPSELVDHYFSSVANRDIERFVSLFADDAIMILPDGRKVVGASAIRKMEQGVFDTTPMAPTPVAICIGENSVAVEVEVRMPGGTVFAIADFFDLNDQGRIQRLNVYRKGN